VKQTEEENTARGATPAAGGNVAGSRCRDSGLVQQNICDDRKAILPWTK
jgi:hypothetical protein